MSGKLSRTSVDYGTIGNLVCLTIAESQNIITYIIMLLPMIIKIPYQIMQKLQAIVNALLMKNKLQYVTMCVMIFLTVEIFLALRKVTKMRKIVLQQAHELDM